MTGYAAVYVCCREPPPGTALQKPVARSVLFRQHRGSRRPSHERWHRRSMPSQPSPDFAAATHLSLTVPSRSCNPSPSPSVFFL